MPDSELDLKVKHIPVFVIVSVVSVVAIVFLVTTPMFYHKNTNFYFLILGSSDREAYPWSWSSRLVSSAPCQRIWPGRKITIEKFTPKVSRIVSAIFIIDKSGQDFYVQKIQNYPTYIWRKGWWQNTTPFIPTSIASEQLSYSGKLVETFYLQNGVDKKSSWRQHKCFF
jgi:hypothetical protein